MCSLLKHTHLIRITKLQVTITYSDVGDESIRVTSRINFPSGTPQCPSTQSQSFSSTKFLHCAYDLKSVLAIWRLPLELLQWISYFKSYSSLLLNLASIIVRIKSSYNIYYWHNSKDILFKFAESFNTEFWAQTALFFKKISFSPEGYFISFILNGTF